MEEASATSPEPEEAVTWSLNSLRSWDFEGQNWIMASCCVNHLVVLWSWPKTWPKMGMGPDLKNTPNWWPAHVWRKAFCSHLHIICWTKLGSFPTFWGSGLFLEERNWRQLMEKHHSNSTVGRMRMLVFPFPDDLPIENGYLPKPCQSTRGYMGTLW